MIEDKNGNLWFGTEGAGVSRYDGTSFISFTESEGLANNFVRAILEDNSGNIWIGTEGGASVLTNFDLKIESQFVFQNFTIADGLPHNMIWSILEDKMGRLWIGTGGGIVVLNDPSQMNWEPTNYKVIVQQDGLRGNNVINSACLDSKNRIWLAMSTGLTMLDLNTFELSIGTPSVQFNGLDISGKFIDTSLLQDSLRNDKSKNKETSLSDFSFSTIPRFRNYPENLSLPYDLNHLTFYYSAIEWEATHKIRYQFKLEGLDENWNELTRESNAEYRNLPHGKFTFKVKAIGASHQWSETFEYPFKIRPPWWLTVWAKVLWVSLFFSLFFAIYKIRTRSLKDQGRRFQVQVAERTEELAQANKSLKKSNDELKEMGEHKESMTAMLVHDFKNSLNTVISFSEDKPTERRVKGINQAGKFMLNMVLNMLDVYKFETTSIKLAPGDYPVSKVINNAIDQVGYLIDQKSIQLNNTQTQEFYSRFDFDLITRCIVNILSNAIKFVPVNGKIEISTVQKGEAILLSIKDNGPGISADKIDQVFDKYSQINAKESGNVRSTGVGLTFCKLVVEEHGGTIGVESEEGEGSNFYFTLPLLENVEEMKETVVEIESSNDKTIVLSEQEKTQLEPYIIELEKWEVFDFSEVVAILEEIDDHENQNIDSWKERMMKALRNGNEEQYKDMLIL